MSISLCLAVLLLSAFKAQSEGANPSRPHGEPTGGLADSALKAWELDANASRQVRLLLDPSAKPSTYVFELPARPPSKGPDADPVKPFRSEMARIGAEAAIYLHYDAPLNGSFVKILRFPKATETEKQWALRRDAGGSEFVTVAGAELLFTKPGQLLREDLRARLNTIECRSGRYWIRVVPASPVPGDPGLKCALKQLEKIMRREPSAAASQSQPSASLTNPSPTAAGPGR